LRARSLAPVFVVAAAACTPDPGTPNAACATDGDCGGGSFCIADLTAERSYCAPRCAIDSDCAAHQKCRTGIDFEGSGTKISFCIDRVRECGMTDFCNGLDDDCDGTIDGARCQPVTGCLDDEACGAFVCTAPENQPQAICQAQNELANVRDFELCTAGTECRNGACETGRCSPHCRPFGRDATCTVDFTCARAVGSRASPAHNSCQKLCDTSRACAGNQRCVWRDVYQGGNFHAFVCSTPGPGRLPLGAACSGNNAAGDDECADGLCYEFRCTRPCGGPGADCSDVGAGLECDMHQLIYGEQQFQVAICAEPL
jgi:hypothetical protein